MVEFHSESALSRVLRSTQYCSDERRKSTDGSHANDAVLQAISNWWSYMKTRTSPLNLLLLYVTFLSLLSLNMFCIRFAIEQWAVVYGKDARVLCGGTSELSHERKVAARWVKNSSWSAMARRGQKSFNRDPLKLVHVSYLVLTYFTILSIANELRYLEDQLLHWL